MAATCSGSRSSRSAKAARLRCFSGCASATDCEASRKVQDIWVFPKIGVGPPSHPFVHRVFHDFKPSILGDKFPLFLVQHPSTSTASTESCCCLQKAFDQSIQSMIFSYSCHGLAADRTPTKPGFERTEHRWVSTQK